MSNLTAAVASGILPRVNAGNLERLMDMDFSKVGEGLKNVPSELKGFFTNLLLNFWFDNQYQYFGKHSSSFHGFFIIRFMLMSPNIPNINLV